MSQQDVFNDQYSKYYNLFYAGKSYASEVDYVVRTIKKFHPKASKILEFGSGTGGHGLLLQKHGYEISGVELSSEMAKIAQKKGYNCRVGNMVDVSLDATFDVVIALFHVVSYINPNQQLVQLFKNARKHLNIDGIFIFDVWFTPAVIYQMPAVRIKKAEDDEIEITRLAEPVLHHLQNVVDVNYHIITKNKKDGKYLEFSEKHSMRHFSVPEVELLAMNSGFLLQGAEEFLTGNEPSVDTWGVNFILKAI
jgi:SAM-dependent methyltransferase